MKCGNSEKHIILHLQKQITTYHWVLTEIVVRSPGYRVELHQVLKVTDLPLDPFLKTNIIHTNDLLHNLQKLYNFDQM